MKKSILFVLMIVILMPVVKAEAQTEKTAVPAVYIGGTEDSDEFNFEGSQPYWSEENIFMVPLTSGVFARLGHKVSYDWISQECIVAASAKIIAMHINEYVIVNKGAVAAKVLTPATRIDKTVYVPLEAYLILLGDNYSYDLENNKLYLGELN